MNRRDFIKTSLCAMCLCSAFAAGKAYYFGNSHDIKYAVPDDTFDNMFEGTEYVKNVDVHLVEHCNLSCKYCCHFTNIAEPEFWAADDYARDIKQLAKVSDGKVRNILLLGGEPLLHPAINEFMRLTRESFPYSCIQVLTNGILLNSMPDNFWKAMHKYSIILRQSFYPIDIPDRWKFFKKAEKYAVIVSEKPEEYNEKLVTEFFKLDLHFKGDVDYKKRFDICDKKFACGQGQLYHGKLYQCWVTPGIKHFNKKFGMNLQVTDDDVLDIYKAKNFEDIKRFTDTPTPFCRYCGEITKSCRWQSGGEHDITEWTYQYDKNV